MTKVTNATVAQNFVAIATDVARPRAERVAAWEDLQNFKRRLKVGFAKLNVTAEALNKIQAAIATREPRKANELKAKVELVLQNGTATTRADKRCCRG